MTGDETWVHHPDPENKRQSMEYRHTRSPAAKEFKTKASAGRAMLTVFWNYEGLALTDLLVKGATVKSERYPTISKKNSSGRRGQKVMISCFNKAISGLPRPEFFATADTIARLAFTLLSHPARVSLLAISTSCPN